MNWDVVWSSFATLCSFENLFVLFAGMIVGIIIGALPGLTATMGVALALPLTFTMEPVTAIVLLIAIYCGGIYGGSITAILMKTPGTPAAAATAIDGYELAKKGQAKKALDMALWASVFGGIASFFALFFIAPQLAKFALKFGPPEFACLALFGLTIIISMASGSLVKGLIAGCIGVAMGFIGIDKVENCMRFTFDSTDLINGLRLVPCMIGLFAMSQVYTQYEEMFANKGKEKLKIESGNSLTFVEFFKEIGNLIRGSVIGILIGAMPGTGSAIASFLNYNEAKRFSKDKENIGKGSLSGVCASEVANNAVTGAAFIPLLTLGIPGDVTTAVILGALMMQGLIPGTTFFTLLCEDRRGSRKVPHADHCGALRYRLLCHQQLFLRCHCHARVLHRGLCAAQMRLPDGAYPHRIHTRPRFRDELQKRAYHVQGQLCDILHPPHLHILPCVCIHLPDLCTVQELSGHEKDARKRGYRIASARPN